MDLWGGCRKIAESCKFRYMSIRPSTWACVLTAFCGTLFLYVRFQSFASAGKLSSSAKQISRVSVGWSIGSEGSYSK